MWIVCSLGLAVGLKNDLDQLVDLVGDFDFAVNEQCYRFNECNKYTPFEAGGCSGCSSGNVCS